MDLVFNNGEKRRIDMFPHLDKGYMVSLKDKDMFIQFGLTDTTIEWVNGIDLAPEFLLENSELLETDVDLLINQYLCKRRTGSTEKILSLLSVKKRR